MQAIVYRGWRSVAVPRLEEVEQSRSEVSVVSRHRCDGLTSAKVLIAAA